MTIVAHSTLANVYASLDTYILGTIGGDVSTGGSGLAVHLHGVRRFVPPVDDPWVQVHYDFLGLQQQYMHYANTTQYATERQGYLQFNVYQRARLWATRYTTAAARDSVISAFPDGKIVSIYDYSNPDDSTPDEVGYLHTDGTKEHVQDSGLQSGVIQHVIQVSCRYFEYFTR